MRKRSQGQDFPVEPLLEEEIPAEPRRQRFQRLGWILGVALILIGLLVWLLSRSNPKPTAQESIAQGENSPDAVVEKMHLVSTVQGVKRWEMYADEARLYQAQKVAYADNIYAQYYKQNKVVSTLTGDEAVINTENDATQARGHVELVVENGSKLETDKLNWDPDTDQIKTDSWVHIYKGKDEITAVGLTADTELNNIHFTSDVHTKMRDTRDIQNFNAPKSF